MLYKVFSLYTNQRRVRQLRSNSTFQELESIVHCKSHGNKVLQFYSSRMWPKSQSHFQWLNPRYNLETSHPLSESESIKKFAFFVIEKKWLTIFRDLDWWGGMVCQMKESQSMSEKHTVWVIWNMKKKMCTELDHCLPMNCIHVDMIPWCFIRNLRKLLSYTPHHDMSMKKCLQFIKVRRSKPHHNWYIWLNIPLPWSRNGWVDNNQVPLVVEFIPQNVPPLLAPFIWHVVIVGLSWGHTDEIFDAYPKMNVALVEHSKYRLP